MGSEVYLQPICGRIWNGKFLIKLFYFTVVLSLTYELKIFFLFSSLDKVHLLILNMDITILTI